MFNNIVSVALRNASSDTPLLSPHELRVDALRGLLPTHGARVRLHLRAEACAVADSFGLECAGSLFDPLRLSARFRQ